MKDNFSSHSADYARFRPAYPQEVYEFIRSKLHHFENAWDCGTGNGQVAAELSRFFLRVKATDISENQIENAVQKDNIEYFTMPAENSSFPDNYFDLVISAQAVHWFEFSSFYKEVQRVLRRDGWIILMGYGLFSSNDPTNEVIRYFYKDLISEYWDPERRYLDEKYESIPFPFREIATPHFFQTYEWGIEHLLGYLRTWSAVKHFQRKEGEDPVSLIEKDLRRAFGSKNKINFPILFRMGKLYH